MGNKEMFRHSKMSMDTLISGRKGQWFVVEVRSISVVLLIWIITLSLLKLLLIKIERLNTNK